MSVNSHLASFVYFSRYVNCRDWESARRVAEQHDASSLTDILIASASSAFKEKEFQKAESYLLQAQKPDLAVKLYRVEAALWLTFLSIINKNVTNIKYG